MKGFALVAIILLRNIQGRLDIKLLQSQYCVKCRSRVSGHGACLKSVSVTITMQGFTLAAFSPQIKTFLFKTQNSDIVNGT